MGRDEEGVDSVTNECTNEATTTGMSDGENFYRNSETNLTKRTANFDRDTFLRRQTLKNVLYISTVHSLLRHLIKRYAESLRIGWRHPRVAVSIAHQEHPLAELPRREENVLWARHNVCVRPRTRFNLQKKTHPSPFSTNENGRIKKETQQLYGRNR